MQLNLNFSTKPIVSGKKTERLAVPCSEEFLKFLDLLSELLDTSRAELAFQFVLDGMQKALGNAFMAEPHLEKSLKDILNKG